MTSLPESQLKKTLNRWLTDGSSDFTRFSGSNEFFDFEVEMFVQLHQHKAIATARIRIQQINPSHVQNRLYSCHLRLQGHTMSNRGTRVQFPAQSCLVHDPQPGQLYFIPFPNQTFASDESLIIDNAYFALQVAQFALPAKYAIAAPLSLATFNDPDLSDCSILPKDSTDPIHLSRALLVRGSPYFVTMIKGAWAQFIKSDVPIEFGWSASALLPCLIHIYSGWVVGEPMPGDAMGSKVERANNGTEDNHWQEASDGYDDPSALPADLFSKYAVDLTAMSVHQWLELMDLARLLELPAVVAAANREMVRVLNDQFDSVTLELKKQRMGSTLDAGACFL